MGLERVAAVLKRLELKKPSLVINVAGTNGKGSSVAMLEALFRHAGHSTGSYTSPHIRRYNERFRVNGEPASDDEIISALTRVEAKRGDVPLTYFEFGTLAALVIFAERGVDTLILEVGMGGRLDAVNALHPDASLITNVSLDHCAWLGDDVESIAAEKAGVMRAGKPVIFGSSDMPRAITDYAAEIGAELHSAGRQFNFVSNPDSSWDWHGRDRGLRGLLRPALAGDMQLINASAVLAVVEALGLDEILDVDLVNQAFGSLHLDGRFQVIPGNPGWVLDVAHNEESARVLAQSLATLSGKGVAAAIIGQLADKNTEGIVRPLLDHVDSWIAVSVDSSRGASAASVARDVANASDKPCLICEDIAVALEEAAMRSSERDYVLVTGSFYIVGPALDWLRNRASNR